MTRPAYDRLAAVYEWLVPDDMLEPQGAVDAFSAVVDRLPPASRILDCAAGTGQLAVGLALRGHRVVASDASPAMVDRVRELARRHAASLEAMVCSWDELGAVGGTFDAVFCVGNSLTHAAGRSRRRDALSAMRSVLRDGGLLAVTSRNWERVRDQRVGLEVGDRLVRRGDRSGLVIRHWTVPGNWDAPHHMEVAVAVVGEDGTVATTSERLTVWPFTNGALEDDLRAAGFEPVASTYAPDAVRYQVTARRRGGA